MQQRPIPGVSAIVVEGGRVLLVRRGQEPNKGLWSLPGGSIEFGETARDAVIREVREETSLDVEPTAVAAVQDIVFPNKDNPLFHYVVIVFQARVVGGTLAAASDAAETCWVPLKDIDRLPTTEGLADIIRSAGAP